LTADSGTPQTKKDAVDKEGRRRQSENEGAARDKGERLCTAHTKQKDAVDKEGRRSRRKPQSIDKEGRRSRGTPFKKSMAGTQMQVQENDAGDKDQQKKSRQKPPVMKCEAADRRHAT